MTAAEDAQTLATAFKGLGTDEAAVIRVLAHRNPYQIEEIKQAFQNQFGKDLSKEIHSELSGNFLKVIDGILKGHPGFEIEQLHHAIKGLGTDEHAIIEILVGKNNEESLALAAAYERAYGKTLKDDIANDTSGDFKHILLALLDHRHTGHSNQGSVASDAEALFKAGEGKLGTDEKVFIEIFTRSSYPHLKEVFEIYENQHKHHTILQALENEFSGDTRTVLKAIALYAINPGDYYADLVYHATKGVGTNDAQLIRVIVGQRYRIVEIKNAFSQKFNHTLHNFIRDDTSGDYRHALLALIGDE